MAINRFKVIKGGVDLPPDIDSRRFVYAYATDTRLMGVVGLRIHWEVEKFGVADDLYQFFYLDAEEYALENYVAVRGNNPEELTLVENKLMGGLGGEKVPLTERDCACLLTDFAEMNERLGLPLPGDVDEYSFMLRDPLEFTTEDRFDMMKKICTPLENYYQLAHYFLMRVFGHDYVAAKSLTKYDFYNECCEYDPIGLNAPIALDIYKDIPAATLCKNTIDVDFTAPQPHHALICESLLETGDEYVMAISKITADSNKNIIGFERINSFRVSSAEAAMQLSKGEFMTIYQMMIDPMDFESYAGKLLETAMVSNHDNGRLYMIFHKNNDHVKKRVFMLNEDVSGVIYVSDFGQVIAVAYDVFAIHKLEYAISKTRLSRTLYPTAKYEFKESVLYDFIQSGIEDFEEFLDYIKDDDNE